MRDEGRVGIMHYSWWLLGLREKGLCSISVFEASTLSLEREQAREIESETGDVSRAGGVAFPEGRSREKAAGGCWDTKGRRWRKGIEQGGLQFRNGFHSADEPPPPFPFLNPPASLPLRSFLRAGLNWGGSTPFPSSRLLHVIEKERERQKEREGEDARNERNAAELDGKVVASHISLD